MTSYIFSNDFPRWKVLPCDSFRSEVVLLTKRNMLRDLRGHSERFKMVTRASPKFKFAHFFLIIIIIIRCSGMFRNVPGCSMFRLLSTAQVMRRKELFYHVTSGSNVMRDVHWCVTVFYQQIENCNMANQIHGFTIDYGKFILKSVRISSSGVNWGHGRCLSERLDFSAKWPWPSFVYSLVLEFWSDYIWRTQALLVLLVDEYLSYFHCQNSHGFSLRATPVPL